MKTELIPKNTIYIITWSCLCLLVVICIVRDITTGFSSEYISLYLVLGWIPFYALFDAIKQEKKDSAWKIKIAKDVEQELEKTKKSRLETLIEMKRSVEKGEYGYGYGCDYEVKKYRNDLLLQVLEEMIELERKHDLIEDL